MKILYLSRWYPDPPDNGSKIRILNLLRALCDGHDVTLISFVDPGWSSAAWSKAPGPVEIRTVPYREFQPGSRRALLGYFCAQPRWIVDTYSREMESLIREAVSNEKFDLVIASQTSMACYWRSFEGIPAILEELELGCFYPENSGERFQLKDMRARIRWAKHRRFVAGLLQHFSICTVASDTERRLLAEAVPWFTSVRVLPNSVPVDSYTAPSGERIPGSLIFAGSLRYAANLDAMTWFVSDIYPHIRSAHGSVRLTITGDPGEGSLPESQGVILTGRVPDVHSVIAASAVSVAPIRLGGGTRLKILESFALGTPVVATGKAVEGLEIKNGVHFILADHPEDFARSVLNLLREPEAARQMAGRAMALVRARYDWAAHSRDFLQLVHQAADT